MASYKVAQELVPSAVDNILGRTQYIHDDNYNLDQKTINKRFSDKDDTLSRTINVSNQNIENIKEQLKLNENRLTTLQTNQDALFKQIANIASNTGSASYPTIINTTRDGVFIVDDNHNIGQEWVPSTDSGKGGIAFVVHGQDYSSSGKGTIEQKAVTLTGFTITGADSITGTEAVTYLISKVPTNASLGTYGTDWEVTLSEGGSYATLKVNNDNMSFTITPKTQALNSKVVVKVATKGASPIVSTKNIYVTYQETKAPDVLQGIQLIYDANQTSNTQQIGVRALPSTISISNTDFNWEILDSASHNKVSISNTGTVSLATGISGESFTVKATYKNNSDISAVAVITGTYLSIEEIAIYGPSYKEGTKAQFTTLVYPKNATRNYTWTVVTDATGATNEYATIDQNGLVTILPTAVNGVTIGVRVSDSNGTPLNYKPCTVKYNKAGEGDEFHIQMLPSSIYSSSGIFETSRAYAKLNKQNSDGTWADVPGGVVWSITEGSEYATISEDGLITLKSLSSAGSDRYIMVNARQKTNLNNSVSVRKHIASFTTGTADEDPLNIINFEFNPSLSSFTGEILNINKYLNVTYKKDSSTVTKDFGTLATETAGSEVIPSLLNNELQVIYSPDNAFSSVTNKFESKSNNYAGYLSQDDKSTSTIIRASLYMGQPITDSDPNSLQYLSVIQAKTTVSLTYSNSGKSSAYLKFATAQPYFTGSFNDGSHCKMYNSTTDEEIPAIFSIVDGQDYVNVTSDGSDMVVFEAAGYNYHKVTIKGVAKSDPSITATLNFYVRYETIECIGFSPVNPNVGNLFRTYVDKFEHGPSVGYHYVTNNVEPSEKACVYIVSTTHLTSYNLDDGVVVSLDEPRIYNNGYKGYTDGEVYIYQGPQKPAGWSGGIYINNN